jgi:predicted protein tyrosine phosphatase
MSETNVIIPKRLKVVTTCRGGHVRSVGLKYRLTYVYGHDVIACGHESNSEEVRRMLYEWADVIVIMESYMEEYIPKEFHITKDGKRKLFCYDVGEDRFGNPFHPELQAMLENMIQKHKLFI